MPEKLSGRAPTLLRSNTLVRGAMLGQGPFIGRKLGLPPMTNTFPRPGSTLDIDFTRNLFYAKGKGIADSLAGIGGSFTRASTKTYFGSDGLLKTAAVNELPIEYDPATLQPVGYISWEARTNIAWNALFPSFTGTAGNNVWVTPVNITATANSATSVDGTVNAALISANTTTSFQYVYQRTAVAVDGTYTISVIAKPNSSDLRLSLFLAGDTVPTNYGIAEYTLSGNGALGGVVNNGTATGSAQTITLLSGGWYLCTLSVVLVGTTNITGAVYPGTRASQTTSSQTLFSYAQVEAGPHATARIVTTGASVTRAADLLQVSGGNFYPWYNFSEGTVACNVRWDYPVAIANGSSYAFAISDNTSVNILFTAKNDTTNSLVIGNIFEGTGLSTTSSSIVTLGAFSKLSLSYKQVLGRMSKDGVTGTLSTLLQMPRILDRLWIGVGYNGASRWTNGPISRFTYFPKRLADNICQELTK